MEPITILVGNFLLSQKVGCYILSSLAMFEVVLVGLTMLEQTMEITLDMNTISTTNWTSFQRPKWRPPTLFAPGGPP
jgi:hypothetical protein